MNLVLIGYRGTGKSTVARLLGERLGMQVVSLDAEIVCAAGRPIPAIVAEHGWPHFRELEAAVTKRVSERDGLILDCGGGVILRDDNVANLRRHGTVIWLRASVAAIVARIEGGTERPALTAGKSFTEEVEEVLRERTPRYAAAAHHQVDTDGLSPADVAAQVAQLFRR
jgi:shikimate kinase